MGHDRDRENSFGGFQYRWNYDEYQKSLQRKRKKSAARGMRAFCLTTVFVFLLCPASLLVVLTASLLRGMLYSLPSPTLADKETNLVLPTENSDNPVTDAPLPQQPADPDMPTTEPLDNSILYTPKPELQEPQKGPAPVIGNTDPPADLPDDIPEVTEPAIQQGEIRDDYSASDEKNLFTELSVSEIAETCSASTVTVQCKGADFQSIGSGFFLTDDGYIVTNNHVIRHAEHFQIRLSDGVTYEAQLVGAEPSLDLAVLKIEAADLPVVTVGSSDEAAVGDQVVAIGTPGSVNFAGTVTYGYISGLDRTVELTDDEDQVIGQIDMIQITAVINPGNSGGPLFNRYGEVIAINTMKLTGEGIEGMGFAIPISDVYTVLTEHIDAHRAANAPETEEITEVSPPDTESAAADTAPTTDVPQDTVEIIIDERPYAAFGVRCETVTEKEAQLYKLPVGVIIRYLEPGSHAENNGLRTGDMILSVNGTPIPDVAALDAWAQTVRVGDTAEIVIFRAGTEMTVTVIFGDPASVDISVEEGSLPAAA